MRGAHALWTGRGAAPWPDCAFRPRCPAPACAETAGQLRRPPPLGINGGGRGRPPGLGIPRAGPALGFRVALWGQLETRRGPRRGCGTPASIRAGRGPRGYCARQSTPGRAPTRSSFRRPGCPPFPPPPRIASRQRSRPCSSPKRGCCWARGPLFCGPWRT